MKFLNLIIICMLIFISSISAQTETIHLWPDGAPGAIKDPNYKVEISSEKE